MTGASDTFDPIAAAEAGIVGSKNLMAAVADELSQQQRWLAHYQVAEKRHARRVKVQGVLYQLELARRALMRFLRRLALLSLRFARSVVSFVSRTAIALFVTLSRALTACITWVRFRAPTRSRFSCARWLAAFWAWTDRDLAHARPCLAQGGIEWLVVQSCPTRASSSVEEKHGDRLAESLVFEPRTASCRALSCAEATSDSLPLPCGRPPTTVPYCVSRGACRPRPCHHSAGPRIREE